MTTTYLIQHLTQEPDTWETWQPDITVTDLVSASRGMSDSGARVGGVWRILAVHPDGRQEFVASYVRTPEGLPVPLPILAEPSVSAAWRQMVANLQRSAGEAQALAVELAADLANVRAHLLSAELRTRELARLNLRLLHVAAGVA